MKKALFMLVLLAISLGASTINLNYAVNETKIYVDPASTVDANLTPNSTFTVSIRVDNVASLAGYEYKLYWAKSVLEFVSVHDTLPSGWSTATSFIASNETNNDFDATFGRFYFVIVKITGNAFTGSFTAREVTFRVKSVGSTALDLQETILGDENANDMPHDEVDGLFSNVGEQPKVHDVAVTNAQPSTTSANVGDSVNIVVTVANHGNFSEATNVTAFSASSEIGKQSISLGQGETKAATFAWVPTSAGTYTISAKADTVTNETNIADNTFIDGTVTVTSEQPPPVGGKFVVQWTNYSLNPKYPFWGGKYHSGQYPVWKNFTIIYSGDDKLVYVYVKYPDATPNFKPSRYEIRAFPKGSEEHQNWIVNANLEDRQIEFTAGECAGIEKGGFAIVSIEFIQGPTEEDCINGHEFAVTVSEKSTTGQTFYLKEYIDKTPPNVAITFPGEDAAQPPAKSYSFVRRNDGYIWVLMPNCTNKNIKKLWINGTSSDSCSGINRVEIWIYRNDTADKQLYYKGDATLSKPVESVPKQVTWWWSVDPLKHDPGFWKNETWYYVLARAYDNSVNDEILAEGHTGLPRTNFNKTEPRWFFYIGVEGPEVVACLDHTPIDWVPGNGRLDVWGKTGFYPNTEVEIWLENDLYGAKLLLTKIVADNNGRFYKTIYHLPEVPRGPRCEDLWVVKAVQKKGDFTATGADNFCIVPWTTYEDTLEQDSLETWDTTQPGNVGHSINVTGHGFLPSKQPEWGPNTEVTIQIVFTDVAPLENSDSASLSRWRRIFNGTSQLNCDNITWSPRLSEFNYSVAPKTDFRGYWSATIQIPQCFGGLHAIYAREVAVLTEPGKSGPKTDFERNVVNGWPTCTHTKQEEQAVLFDVYPEIKAPSTVLTGQYMSLNIEGLPLPKYYKLKKNNIEIIKSRDWCLVIDFGGCEQWVFENKRIRNNELDSSWALEMWYPFSYYSPDIADNLDSPVWKGKLTSATTEFTSNDLQFHIGSRFLKVPVLPADNYNLTVYYFDKETQFFVRGGYAAQTEISVLKDPLNLRVEVGKIHFPGEIVDVLASIDVDGITEDATTLSFGLFKGDTFVQALNYGRIDEGAYVASFTCPSGEGDYFVKASASVDYELFKLYGSSIASFTVSPTMNGYNSRLVTIEGKIATLQTDVGEIKVDLSTVNARIVSIESGIATIETNLGTLSADITSINSRVVSIEGAMATLKTDLGNLTTSAQNINAVITGLHGDVVEISTLVGKMEAKLEELNGVVTIEKDVATIKTDIGELNGRVLKLEGNTATIKTDLGTITTKTDSIVNNISLQPFAIGLALIAALLTIAAAIVILRKIYPK